MYFRCGSDCTDGYGVVSDRLCMGQCFMPTFARLCVSSVPGGMKPECVPQFRVLWSVEGGGGAPETERSAGGGGCCPEWALFSV